MRRSYGPNTRLIEGFLERLGHMDLPGFEDVVRTWRDTLRASDEWYEAEDAVGDAIARTRRDHEMWLLQDAIYGVFRGAKWYDTQTPGKSHAPAEAAAQYLATTAAVALMVADVLPAGQLSTLYAPFRDVVPLADLTVTGRPYAEPGLCDVPRLDEPPERDREERGLPRSPGDEGRRGSDGSHRWH